MPYRISRSILAGGILGCAIVFAVPSTCRSEEPPELNYGAATLTGHLQCREVRESSGIAISRAEDGAFWTHNDSGDDPRLFAFQYDGSHLGTWTVNDAEARDWEDMASLRRKGQPLLLIADTGDNLKQRSSCRLYVVPDEMPEQRVLQVQQTIPFRFATGPQDCEAVAYDAQYDQILLIAKGWEPQGEVHTLAWPPQNHVDALPVTKLIGTLNIAGITGLDISPDGRHAVVVTYGNARVFSRKNSETWAEGFARPGQSVALPPRKQGESICFDTDGVSLLLTSEKRPTPVYRLRGQASAAIQAASER